MQSVVEMYRKKQGISEQVQILLKFDGELLDIDSDTLADIDVDDDDQLDVIIRS